MTVIFKKKGKKKFALYSLGFVRVDEWWLKFLFFLSLHFYNPVFSHLISNIKWMNGYWVLLKSAYTRFPRVPFAYFNIKSCSLLIENKKKKFNFVPSSLSLTYSYYFKLSVKFVCSFPRGPDELKRPHAKLKYCSIIL
jgi:hypothetical protein